MTRRDDSLIGQVVAANVVLVALTLFAASLAAGLDLYIADHPRSLLILAVANMLTLCVNLWMLQRRFAPLERLIKRIESIDPAEPSSHHLADSDPVEEIDRLSTSFNRLLERIEEERRRSGTLAMRAQEEERRRLARDLHDEVNQALTAILLRLEALSQDSPPDRLDELTELKRLVNQAMEELLNLARQLRPTALDDHGLMPAIETQLKRFSARTGIEVRVSTEGEPETLPEDVQTAVYRILQEALANIGRHAAATAVSVEMEVEDERLELHIRDDGVGFDPSALVRENGNGPGAGLGLSGMVERARLAGGELDLRSAPGGGTTVTLRIGRLVRVAS
jgi:two-component system sensor histidine kinase UhpB